MKHADMPMIDADEMLIVDPGDWPVGDEAERGGFARGSDLQPGYGGPYDGEAGLPLAEESE